MHFVLCSWFAATSLFQGEADFCFHSVGKCVFPRMDAGAFFHSSKIPKIFASLFTSLYVCFCV